MDATEAQEDDEAFLDTLFELAVVARGNGEPIDLDRLLADRPHLRKRAVEIVELAAELAPVAGPGLPTLRLPKLQGYEILGEVGRGGMGVVYRARQVALGRFVAFKVLSPALASLPRSRERFQLEARALAKLHHQNIVAVYDVSTDPDVCAYTMEWVEGMTLAQSLATSGPRLDPPAVAKLGITVARALDFVHKAGLIHRDVKPGNILLRRDGTPVLSDFSLVHDEELTLHTQTGEFIGTAAFAAPEQLRGDHKSVSPRSDVYSLAATLYAVLAGEGPYGTSSSAEILRRMERGLLVPLRKKLPGILQDLATIIGVGMDHDPARRYATAELLAQDLERFLRYEPILARPANLVLKLRRFAQRRPAVATASVLLSLLTVLGPTLLYLQERRALRRETVLRETAEKQEGLELAADRVLSPNPDYEPEVVFTARSILASIALSIGKLEAARRLLDGIEDLWRQVHQDDSAEAGTAVFELGRLSRDIGRPEEALGWFQESVRIRRVVVQQYVQLPGHNLQRNFLAQSLNSVAILLRRKSKLAEAEQAFSEALDLYRKSLGEINENVAMIEQNMAALELQQGRTSEAEQRYRRSVAIFQDFHRVEGVPKPHLDIATAQSKLAACLSSMGRFEEARPLFLESTETMRSLVGNAHRKFIDCAKSEASHAKVNGLVAHAESLLREAWDGCQKIGSFDADYSFSCGAEFSDLLRETGRSPEAVQVLTLSIDRAESSASARGWYRRRAIARAASGDFSGAAEDITKSWKANQGAAHHVRLENAKAAVGIHSEWTKADPSEERSSELRRWENLVTELEASRSK